MRVTCPMGRFDMVHGLYELSRNSTGWLAVALYPRTVHFLAFFHVPCGYVSWLLSTGKQNYGGDRSFIHFLARITFSNLRVTKDFFSTIYKTSSDDDSLNSRLVDFFSTRYFQLGCNELTIRNRWGDYAPVTMPKSTKRRGSTTPCIKHPSRKLLSVSHQRLINVFMKIILLIRIIDVSFLDWPLFPQGPEEYVIFVLDDHIVHAELANERGLYLRAKSSKEEIFMVDWFELSLLVFSPSDPRWYLSKGKINPLKTDIFSRGNTKWNFPAAMINRIISRRNLLCLSRIKPDHLIHQPMRLFAGRGWKGEAWIIPLGR